MPESLVEKPADSEFARSHPRWYLSAHAVVGFVAAALCAWAFAAIADEVPEHAAMARIDLAVTAWLQSHGTEWGETVFATISLLGAQVLIAVLVAVAILLIRKRAWRPLATLVVACGGGALLNSALKAIFHRTRPLSAAEFRLTSWSFPSGHAMDSLIVYGLFAFWLVRRLPERRHAIIIAAVVLVGAIGFARIYLGVHYVSDVVAGYCAGAVWLFACITGERFASRRHVGSSPTDV